MNYTVSMAEEARQGWKLLLSVCSNGDNNSLNGRGGPSGMETRVDSLGCNLDCQSKGLRRPVRD